MNILQYDFVIEQIIIYLEDESYEYDSHEETILYNTFEDVLLIWFPSIELIESLLNQKKKKIINKHMWLFTCLRLQFKFYKLTWQRTKALKINVFFTLVACVGSSCWRPRMVMPLKLRTNNTLT